MLAFLLVVGLGLAACGETKTIEKTSSTKTVVTIKQGKTKTVTTQAGGGGGGGGGGTTSSGGFSLSNASLGFAQNVRQAYLDSGGGSRTVTAYSPVKGRSYEIFCRPTGGRVTCSGGTTSGAVISFSSSGGGSGGGGSSSGGNLTWNAQTSAGFAQNVREAYVSGGSGSRTVTAYSPANGREYQIYCSDNGSRVTCSGGTTTGAVISFDS